MKKRLLILAGILTISMSAAPVAWAEEAPAEEAPAEETGSILDSLGGLADQLFGEEGSLKDLLPEGTDIEGMVNTVKDQVEDLKNENSELIDSVVEMVKDEIGDYDMEKVSEVAGSILGAIMGEEGEDFDFAALDAYIAQYNAIKDSIKEYIAEKNADILEAGDEMIISLSLDYKEPEADAEEIRVFCQGLETNYTLEGTELHVLNAAGDTFMFTFQAEEDGTLTIADVMQAEDGEGYTASVEAMAEAAGFTSDEAFALIDEIDLSELIDLEMYLEEHPEITGIEYMGEIRTADDFSELENQYFEEMYPDEEEAIEEAEAEEAAVEEAVEEAADEAAEETADDAAEETADETAEETADDEAVVETEEAAAE